MDDPKVTLTIPEIENNTGDNPIRVEKPTPKLMLKKWENNLFVQTVLILLICYCVTLLNLSHFHFHVWCECEKNGASLILFILLFFDLLPCRLLDSPCSQRLVYCFERVKNLNIVDVTHRWHSIVVILQYIQYMYVCVSLDGNNNSIWKQILI